MRLEFAFRVSAYLTLALACVALGYAESTYLPMVLAETVLVVALLVVAFVLDNRGVHLSIRASNWIGGGILAISVLWAFVQFNRRDSLVETLAWPASLLPALAPVLMLLIPAKLFRPKDNNDHWVLQGIGLMCAAMAASLAADLALAGLLAAYALAGVWCVSLFYLWRTHGFARFGEVLPADAPAPPVPKVVGRPPLGRAVLRWSLVASAIAAVLFLGTPRYGDARWELTGGTRKRMEVGFPAGGSIDLNRTGTLQISDEIALEVTAEDAMGRPRLDLDPYRQRFSGRTFDVYAHGTWSQVAALGLPATSGSTAYPPIWPPRVGKPPANELPDLGPRQYFLTFRPRVELGAGFIVSDPVMAVDPQYGPVRTETGDPATSMLWKRAFHGGLYAATDVERKYPWRQVTTDTSIGSRSTFVLLPPEVVHLRREHRSVPGLAEWTRQLVLAHRDRLPADEREEIVRRLQRQDPPNEKHYESVAQLISNHLAHSGEYQYTLQLKRTPNSDPVDDFLRTTKRGHCERFATALAMCCRSVGIPSQLVAGFRGCEHQEGGKYLIRQSHAHAWVEVLVKPKRPTNVELLPAQANGWPAPWEHPDVWQWLTLDPTPTADEIEAEPTAAGWWLGGLAEAVQEAFRSFIVEYDSKQRDKTGAELRRWLASLWSDTLDGLRRGDWGPWAAVGGLVLLLAAAGLVVRGWLRLPGRSRSPRGTEYPPFYARLLAMLARAGHRPAAGETLREFAASVAARLPAGATIVPTELTDLYYRQRFGDGPANADELARADLLLGELTTALKR